MSKDEVIHLLRNADLTEKSRTLYNIKMYSHIWKSKKNLYRLVIFKSRNINFFAMKENWKTLKKIYELHSWPAIIEDQTTQKVYLPFNQNKK